MLELKRALLDRLPRYYHILREFVERESRSTVSSAQIAEVMGVDDTQVRKDLAAIGVRGCPRVGYRVDEVVQQIRDILGFEQTYKGIIVGAGRLGSALAAYPGFAAYGLHIVGIFDCDPVRIGESVNEWRVRPLDEMENAIAEFDVNLAVLTVPAVAAPELAERVVAAGVKAIWNFAPVRFAVPENVAVRHEEISSGLAELSYHLKRFRMT